MPRRGVFLDLNGTLVFPLLQEHLGELTPIAGVEHGVARLVQNGFVCPVVTVQSRIAKGLFSAAAFETWFDGFASRLRDQGAHVEGPYVCPHRFAEPCACKKPNVLLYERAARDHDIDPRRSFVIGDSPDDMRAARRLGARGCLVRTGWMPFAPSDWPEATVVTDTLPDAVEWILSLSERGADFSA
jgi:D-glycero-D-manno-heptose 1,7-bisphosphate phosphatase